MPTANSVCGRKYWPPASDHFIAAMRKEVRKLQKLLKYLGSDLLAFLYNNIVIS